MNENPASGDQGGSSKKPDFWKWFTAPKSRSVIYGVTNRSEDPWFLVFNDFLIDRQKISLKEKARLFQALKLLVNSGVGFIKSLSMLSERTINVRLSRILKTVVYDMQERGVSFSSALQKYPDVFPPSETKMVYSGEITGKIEQTLNSIATQVEKNIQMSMQIRSALMYPLTVIVAIILAGMAVMIFIVPKLTGLFGQFEAGLPLATKILIGISEALTAYWWLLGLGCVVLFFVFRQWYKSEEGRLSWDGFCLKIPRISVIVLQVQTVRIAHNFATLMASGIPVNKALHILADIVPNKVIANAIFDTELEVRQGKKLSEAFGNQPAFDPVLGEILQVGESTGAIPQTLQKLGDQYEVEIEAQLKNISTIIEPIIILVIGAAVVFMMMAVMMPIFQLQTLFSES